jgi:hypothetical protein
MQKSAPHGPLRPTPLAFSLLHQHRQRDWATSQNTEHILLLHQQPQHQLWQANRMLEQWAASQEGLSRTKQWEDQWQERENKHLNHQHPLPSGSALPISLGEVVEDPGQEHTPLQQCLQRIAERVMLPNPTPSGTEGISISLTEAPTSTQRQTQESSPTTSPKSCSTCHTCRRDSQDSSLRI